MAATLWRYRGSAVCGRDLSRSLTVDLCDLQMLEACDLWSLTVSAALNRGSAVAVGHSLGLRVEECAFARLTSKALLTQNPFLLEQAWELGKMLPVATTEVFLASIAVTGDPLAADATLARAGIPADSALRRKCQDSALRRIQTNLATPSSSRVDPCRFPPGLYQTALPSWAGQVAPVPVACQLIAEQPDGSAIITRATHDTHGLVPYGMIDHDGQYRPVPAQWSSRLAAANTAHSANPSEPLSWDSWTRKGFDKAFRALLLALSDHDYGPERKAVKKSYNKFGRKWRRQGHTSRAQWGPRLLEWVRRVEQLAIAAQWPRPALNQINFMAALSHGIVAEEFQHHFVGVMPACSSDTTSNA